MPPLSLKATVTRHQAAELVDQPERLLQVEHHQAVTGASTGAEPAQAKDPEKSRQTAVDAATATPAEPPGKAIKQAPHAVQSAFLTGNLGKPVTVFTINGLRLTGKLKRFDQFTLLLGNVDGTDSLLFKYGITTIAPASEAPGKQRQPE